MRVMDSKVSTLNGTHNFSLYICIRLYLSSFPTFFSIGQNLKQLRISMLGVFAISALTVLMAFCVLPANLFAQHPYKYDVEYQSGRNELFVWMHFDSSTDVNYVRQNDSSDAMPLKRVDVKRIYSISDPIRPPHEIEWTSHKDDGWVPIDLDACDCLGHVRSTAFHLLDAKLGLSYRGNSSYTRVTQTGPVAENSVFFNPFNKGGTNLDIEAGAAIGWRVHHWDLGLQVEVIPTDGFFYFPIALHARYYFLNDCCTWNLFVNAGIPFDFQTGAPIFITPLFDRRQRRYFSAGIGKIWPMNESHDFAIDLGYRYMVIPLDQIQCCPSIEFQNRFPARESQSIFLQAGLSF